MKKITGGILAVLFVCCAVDVMAEDVSIPAAINYQGKLTDPTDGSPIAGGVYEIEFRVWDDPTDTAAENLIWGRVFPVHVMTNGLFNVLLTDNAAEVSNPTPQTNDIRQAFQGEYRYLGLTITHGPAGVVDSPEISPRQRMVSSPFAMHSQNATDAFHAEQADEAKLAQNSEKLGDKSANKYYNEDQFDALGLSGSYNSLLGWASGGGVEKTDLYDYWGKFCMTGANPTEPDNGVKLLIQGGKLQVDDGMLAKDAIIPAPGHDSGIRFPDNIGGGSGDVAGLSYSVATNAEDCELRMYIKNDPEDKIRIEASGNVEISSGRDIEMHGTVRAFGGITEVRNLLDGGGDYDVYAPSDGFYYINSDNVAYTVQLAAFSWYLRSVHDDDYNINTVSYPIAKGEHFKVHLNDNWSGTSHLKVYWRQFGR